MAEAERKTVTREVVTTVEEERVVLSLTTDEAETLYMITESIGGEPTMSRRVHADRIRRALRSTGVKLLDTNTRVNHQRGSAIYFVNEPGIG